MSPTRPLGALCAAAALAVLGITPRAHAFGGVFFGPGDASSHVVRHRTVIARGDPTSTVWDEVELAGAPRDVAWVVPLRAAIAYGIGRGEVFDALDLATAPVVQAPPLACPAATHGGCDGSQSTTRVDTSADVSTIGVRALASAELPPTSFEVVVGADAIAIVDRLRADGLAVSSDDAASLQADAQAGAGFLVARVHASPGVLALGPIRVSARGAIDRVPLRPWGASDASPIELAIVILDGVAVGPRGVATASVFGDALTWDFATSTSDYEAQRSAILARNGAPAFFLDTSDAIASSALPAIAGRTLGAATPPPSPSPWWTSTDPPSVDAVATDVELAFSGQTSRRATRWYAKLGRDVLHDDLVLATMVVGNVTPVARTAGRSANGTCPTTSSIATARVDGAIALAFGAIAAFAIRARGRR